MTAPISDAALYHYFSGACVLGAQNPEAVRGSGTVDTTVTLESRGIAGLSSGVRGGKSAITKWAATDWAFRQLNAETQRTLRFMYYPESKPELRLMEDPEGRARLGVWRSLLDETPSARAAYQQAVDKLTTTPTEAETAKREALTMGAREELADLELRMRLARAGTSAEEFSIGDRARLRVLRKRIEELTVMRAPRRTVPGIGQWLLSVTDSALLKKMRGEASAMANAAADAWGAVKARRVFVTPELEPARKVWDQ